MAMMKKEATLSEKKCRPATIRARLTELPYIKANISASLKTRFRFVNNRASANAKNAPEPCPDENEQFLSHC